MWGKAACGQSSFPLAASEVHVEWGWCGQTSYFWSQSVLQCSALTAVSVAGSQLYCICCFLVQVRSQFAKSAEVTEASLNIRTDVNYHWKATVHVQAKISEWQCWRERFVNVQTWMESTKTLLCLDFEPQMIASVLSSAFSLLLVCWKSSRL